MSILSEINEFLESTRTESVDALNSMIRHMDQSAEPQRDQGFAHSILGYMKMADLKDQVALFSEAKSKAEALKARHGWLFVEPAPEVIEAPVAEKVTAPKAPKVKAEKKSEIAMRIYAGLADKSKANVMATFERELNTSKLGAQTYFYVCNGPTGAQRGRKANPDAAPKVAYVRKPVVSGPTKREQATKLFATATDKSRAVITARFVSELGLTPKGALTYYYTVGGAKLRAAKK